MQGDSIILYPRSYNTRGKEHLHSVYGLSRDGEEVNVKLRIPDEYAERKGAPKISEFAKVDRLAKQPCIASDDNSMEHREGVLLFTNVEIEENARKGYKSYIARWAFVLAEDSNSPEPIIGRGRIHVDKDTPDMGEKRRQLDMAEQKGDRSVAEALRHSIGDKSLYNYPVLLYHNKTTRIFGNPSDEAWFDFVAEQIRQNSQFGIEGGMYVKLHDPRGAIVTPSIHERYSRYDYASMRYVDIDETIDELQRWIRAVWSNYPDARLLMMPASRINPGFRTRRFLAQDAQYDAILKTYYRHEKPLMCPIAVRIQRVDEAGMTFAKKVIPIGKPMGLVENVDDSGTPLAYMRHVSSDTETDDDDLPLERPVGMVDFRFVARRQDLMITAPEPVLPSADPVHEPPYSPSAPRLPSSENGRNEAARREGSGDGQETDGEAETSRKIARHGDVEAHKATPAEDPAAARRHPVSGRRPESDVADENSGADSALDNEDKPRSRAGLARYMKQMRHHDDDPDEGIA